MHRNPEYLAGSLGDPFDTRDQMGPIAPIPALYFNCRTRFFMEVWKQSINELEPSPTEKLRWIPQV